MVALGLRRIRLDAVFIFSIFVISSGFALAEESSNSAERPRFQKCRLVLSSLVAGVSALCHGGCSTPRPVFESVDGSYISRPGPYAETRQEVLYEKRNEITSILERALKRDNKKYLFIVEFFPNDFGRFAGSDVKVHGYLGDFPLKSFFGDGVQTSNARPGSAKSPYPAQQLKGDEAIEFDYWLGEGRPLVGHLIFRHNRDARSAMNTLKSVLGDEKSELFRDTLLIGIGGSHGTAALRSFRDLLKQEGGDFGMIFLNDAIEKPLWFPMKNFYSEGESAVPGVNFYQRDSVGDGTLLNGTDIPGFTNIELHNISHSKAASSEDVAAFLKELRTDSGEIVVHTSELTVPELYYLKQVDAAYPQLDSFFESPDREARVVAARKWLAHHGDLEKISKIIFRDFFYAEWSALPLSSYSPTEIEGLISKHLAERSGVWNTSEQKTFIHFLRALDASQLKRIYRQVKSDRTAAAILLSAMNSRTDTDLEIYEELEKAGDPLGELVFSWAEYFDRILDPTIQQRVLKIGEAYFDRHFAVSLAGPNEGYSAELRKKIILANFRRSSTATLNWAIRYGLRDDVVDDELRHAAVQLVLNLGQIQTDPRTIFADENMDLYEGLFAADPEIYKRILIRRQSKLEQTLPGNSRSAIALKLCEALGVEWKSRLIEKLRSTKNNGDLTLADRLEDSNFIVAP